MAFNEGVKEGYVMQRVAFLNNTPPPFAHTKKPAKKTGKNKELNEFDVAMYSGTTLDELKAYLAQGNVDFSKWTDETFDDLMEHLRIKKCDLGLDRDGNALRVAFLSKVFVYDEGKDLLLFNPLNSQEDDAFVEARMQAMTKDVANLQRAMGEGAPAAATSQPGSNMYAGVAALLHVKDGGSGGMYAGVAAQMNFGKQKKSLPVEIPGAFVFQTTFSPFKESPRDAAARVFAWRFNLAGVSSRIFNKVVHKEVKVNNSQHFPGLRSEYHIHHVLLKPEYVVPLQKGLPVNAVTSVGLHEKTNTGVNTHWYAWLKKSQPGDAMAAQLKALYAENEKVSELLGSVEDSKAEAFGKMLHDEAKLLEQW